MPDFEKIAAQIRYWFEKNQITKVFLANSVTNPPILSYLVNFPLLSVVLEGDYEIEIEQMGQPRLVNVEKGQAVFAPPNCWERPTWKKPVKVAMFLFGKKLTGISLISCDGSSESSIVAEKIPINRPVSGPASKILQSILEFYSTSSEFSAYPQLVQALAVCCLDMLKTETEVRVRKANFLFDEICSYMQHNFQYEITRDSVAAEFKITPNHISRLFRKEGLMRFCDYLTYVRIDRAKFMLQKYDMNLSEIAGRCGFSDSAYFCRIFKKIAKKTPSQYRQLNCRK
ncbi:MAG: AraC family transcriptional regulator [Phycisphaerales bacterium]